jgi:hypothetical protein
LLTLFFIHDQTFKKSDQLPLEPNAANIGAQLLSTTEHGYILPFEVVSILLLAAMIGCIVIAIKIKVPPHKVLPEREGEELELIEIEEELKAELSH